MRYSRRPEILLVGAVATVMSLAACSSNEPPEASPTVTVQVATAQSEPIRRIVTSDAILFPKDEAAIVPQISAPIKKFYVERGSHVHAGEILAQLDDQALQGAYMENQGGYQQAHAGYEAALQNAQQQLALAKQQLTAAQTLYDDRDNLLKQGAVSQKDVEDARIALTQAQNQYQAAQKQYDLESAEGQLAAAKGRVTSAEAELNYTNIKSPINGVVTDRPYYLGETPAAGSPILTVMDLSQIVAKAHIAQDQAARLRVGDAATITAMGASELLQGNVTLISPALDPNSTTVEVWVQAPNPGEKLKPGTNATVQIVAQTVPQAVVIPASALLTATDGSTSVFTVGADNKPKQEDVKVGIRSGDDVQITSGLSAGDRVITAGAYDLANEDPDVLAKTTIQIATPKPAGADDSN